MSLLEQFHQEADARWKRGVSEIRGGDESLPFVGDPVECAMEEALDLRNYAKQGERDGSMPDWAAELVIAAAWDAYRVLWQARAVRRSFDAD